MPRGDGTGPGGMGPMTGRAAGYCAGYDAPGYMNPGPGGGMAWGRGGGFGRGMGRGMAWGRGGRWAAAGAPGYAPPAYAPAYAPPYAPQITKEQELETLKSQAEYFNGALEDISKRISELEAQEE